MRNITHLFDDGPFKNSTFKFYSTTERDGDLGSYYTPHYIANWAHGNMHFTSYRAQNMNIHEICHAIDLYSRGKEESLLKDNFGWAIPDRGQKVPVYVTMLELRVLTLQTFLIQNLYPGVYRRDIQGYKAGSTKRDYRARTDRKFLPTNKLWDAQTAEFFKAHEAIGVKGYMKVWKAACTYVKKNRD